MAGVLGGDLPKGNYRIFVQPQNRNGLGGNYTLKVHGQFANLKKI